MPKYSNKELFQKEEFELYLKETEYRFNHRGQDLYKILLRIFRKNPL